VIAEQNEAVTAVLSLRLPARQKKVLEVVLFGLLPTLMVGLFTVGVTRATFAWDFHPFWEAAGRVVHGTHDLYTPSHAANADGRPYGTYIYPPTLAILLVPLGLLSFGVASIVFIVISIGAVIGSLRLLDVRDWRCYGVVFLWVPVLGNIRLANITAVLLLGIAALWRLRNRERTPTALVALLVVLKLFLWPLLAWEVRSTARRAAVSLGATAVLATASWGVLGFVGLRHYETILRRFESFWQDRGYGFGPVLGGVGLSSSEISLVLSSIALLSTIIVAALRVRRTVDDRQFLTLLVAVSLALSPVSWLHYATLLVVPIALASRSLSWHWFLPLPLWMTPVEEANGSGWRLTLFFLVIVATSLSAVRAMSPAHPSQVGVTVIAGKRDVATVG
jgi:hypothetical protein